MSAEKYVGIEVLGRLHGHICPGLAIGYRAGLIARREFGIGSGKDHEILVVIEENSCCEDAIQLTTTCSWHRGNILFQKVGSYVFIFYDHTAGKSLQLNLKPEYLTLTSQVHKLKEKVIRKQATPEEEKIFLEEAGKYVSRVLQAKEEDLFSRQEFDMALLVKVNECNHLYVTYKPVYLNTCPCAESKR